MRPVRFGNFRSPKKTGRYFDVMWLATIEKIIKLKIFKVDQINFWLVTNYIIWHNRTKPSKSPGKSDPYRILTKTSKSLHTKSIYKNEKMYTGLLSFFLKHMLIKFNSSKSLGIPPLIQYNIFFRQFLYLKISP